MKVKIRDLVFAVPLSLCAALSLCMAFPFPGEAATADGGRVAGALQNLCASLDGREMPLCVLAAAFLLLHLHNRKNRDKGGLLLSLFCFFCAAVWLMAQGFRIDDTLDALTVGAGQKLKSLLYFVGTFEFLWQLGVWALASLSGWKTAGGEDRAFSRRSFLRFFLALLLCCLPTWVLCYPGYLCADSYTQLAYYFGIYEFVAHHPPIHTLLISWAVRLGMALGSANLGVFLIVCVQMLCFSAVFAYLLETMRSLAAPKWLTAVAFVTIVLHPSFLVQAALVNKDGPYSWGVLLFTLEMLWCIRLGPDYWRRRGHIALLALSILAVALLRHNGKYLLAVCLAILVIRLLVQGRRGGNLRGALVGCACLLVPVIAASVLYEAAVAHYGIGPGSRREALSLPFQQTARLFFEYPEDVTEEEFAAIDGVLDAREIYTEYNPRISDPVKCYFRDDCGTAELAAYFRTWLKQGLRHPLTYLKATFNQNYSLFYPEALTWGRGSTYSAGHVHISEPLGIHEVDVADSLEEILREGDRLMSLLPVPGLTGNAACCALLLALLIIGALRGKYADVLLIALPAFLTFGITFLAPVAASRYSYPLVYTLPLVLTFYGWMAGQKSKGSR